jgi:hypothetical protein
MSRKRGGQPGNRNAYKHGFYARYFTLSENRALSDIPLTDVTNQIGLLRVQVDRFMQVYTASLDKLDYEERLVGLRALTLAVGRIASLERIHASAGKNRDSYNAFIQTLEAIPDELLNLPDQPELPPASSPPHVRK